MDGSLRGEHSPVTEPGKTRRKSKVYTAPVSDGTSPSLIRAGRPNTPETNVACDMPGQIPYTIWLIPYNATIKVYVKLCRIDFALQWFRVNGPTKRMGSGRGVRKREAGDQFMHSGCRV